jgi:hypothetical protein
MCHCDSYKSWYNYTKCKSNKLINRCQHFEEYFFFNILYSVFFNGKSHPGDGVIWVLCRFDFDLAVDEPLIKPTTTRSEYGASVPHLYPFCTL